MTGCGHSTAEVRTAREATYQADRAVVWEGLKAAVAYRYEEGFDRESAEEGILVTKWHIVEKVTAEKSAGGNTQAATTNPGAKMFQIRVRLSQQPPWRVEIDGEAALYRPGMSSLVPYRHGADDEPHWVQGRIDEMYVDIYQRLKQHATKKAAPAPGP